MPISPHDRDRIGREMARIARMGGESLLCYRSPDCARSLKPDGSPVSAADIASEQVIVAALRECFPQWPVISEEGEVDVPPDSSTFFLVDPLDGTRAFLAGRPDFCVLIALIERGIPVAGAIHQPVGEGTWWSGIHAFRGDPSHDAEMLVPDPGQRSGGVIAIVSAEHAGEASRLLCGRMDIAEIRSENSALKFVRLAEGEADLYPRIGRTMQWDVAAGDALLRCLGGGVRGLDGQALAYGRSQLGWANPDFVAYRRLPA
ncbi:3'(2'),5'-bisphosphate nucleotidase CysQ [Rhabdaerophilum sp. SD176]|uniref:3'(2'),5'-bisphosphate nucleotidase CysQ family protein n=1 Tax=Rhabdaerophilum sp. SD176 TaxID=2983548 RepID=UPI0024DF594F|nr:3'(2'),5'-bisphosphate nucleotidase CysQ [Rhabdaerophilum sp. SD176]